ncbi:MAG: hypothetical protein M0010_02550 [Actinomycetota bacterium]|jgi:hypothetical protein|nr:hypothetical protein [Actinomycetota bacterium]
MAFKQAYCDSTIAQSRGLGVGSVPRGRRVPLHVHAVPAVGEQTLSLCGLVPYEVLDADFTNPVAMIPKCQRCRELAQD